VDENAKAECRFSIPEGGGAHCLQVPPLRQAPRWFSRWAWKLLGTRYRGTVPRYLGRYRRVDYFTLGPEENGRVLEYCNAVKFEVGDRSVDSGERGLLALALCLFNRVFFSSLMLWCGVICWCL